jgi:hypothetical protein
MCADCRHGCREQNDTGRNLAIEMPAGNMEIAGRVLFAWLQQEEEQEIWIDRPPTHAKK